MTSRKKSLDTCCSSGVPKSLEILVNHRAHVIDKPVSVRFNKVMEMLHRL